MSGSEKDTPMRKRKCESAAVVSDDDDDFVPVIPDGKQEEETTTPVNVNKKRRVPGAPKKVHKFFNLFILFIHFSPREVPPLSLEGEGQTRNKRKWNCTMARITPQLMTALWSSMKLTTTKQT
jgi:hypothetical protein